MSVDVDRIAEQVNGLWSEYAYALIMAVGVLGLLLVAVGLVKVARSKQRDRWVSGMTAVVVLAWTSEGLWEVARYTLELPVAFAVMAFFVFEAMMVSSGLQAEQHRRRYGTPGPAGRYVWVLATLTATIVAVNAATMVEALLRFTLPLAAAGLWWVGITAPRDSDTEQVKAERKAAAAARAATWAVTPRTLLVAMGIMRPGDQSITGAERERRIRRMVVAADRLHTAKPGSWPARRGAARLRRLARLATADDVEQVRERVTRTTGIIALVEPTQPATQLHNHAAGPQPATAPVEATNPVTQPAPDHPDPVATPTVTRQATHPEPIATPAVAHRQVAQPTPVQVADTPSAATAATPQPVTATRVAPQPVTNTEPVAEPTAEQNAVANHQTVTAEPVADQVATPEGDQAWSRATAEQVWRQATAAGQPLSAPELARMAGRNRVTTYRWIQAFKANSEPHPVNNHQH